MALRMVGGAKMFGLARPYGWLGLSWRSCRYSTNLVAGSPEVAERSLERPKVVILGQPNVGKSTLFNRLTSRSGRRGSGRKTAITLNTPGGHVTRDVIEGRATLGDLRFRVFDTAGHNDERYWQNLGDTPRLENSIAPIVRETLRRSHVALFLVDGRHGLSEPDLALARWVRRNAAPGMLAEGRVRVVLNKCEGLLSRGGSGDLEAAGEEALSLGFGEGVTVSAETGEGMADLYQALWTAFPSDAREAASEAHGQTIRVAVTGRPNVGKSTLVNSLLGYDRVLTGPKPGLTRDSVEVDLPWGGRDFTVVDTAGRVRGSKLPHYDDSGGAVAGRANEDAERAVHFAHVVVLVVDADQILRSVADHRQSSSYLTHFESTIAASALRHGRPLVVLANKMDLVDSADPEERNRVNRLLAEGLPDYQGVRLVPCSAKTGLGVGFLLPAVAEVYDMWRGRVQTSHLNAWLEDLKRFHHGGGPTSILGSMRYAAQVKTRPPTFCFWTKKRRGKERKGENSVAKFLRHKLQESFGLTGIPIRVMFR